METRAPTTTSGSSEPHASSHKSPFEKSERESAKARENST